jgi:hypothetical protein
MPVIPNRPTCHWQPQEELKISNVLSIHLTSRQTYLLYFGVLLDLKQLERKTPNETRQTAVKRQVLNHHLWVTKATSFAPMPNALNKTVLC